MFSTGDFARHLAIERNMTLEAFNEMVAHTRELDLLIDAELERIEQSKDHIVVDSHLAFHFIPSGFSVFLEIPPEESAQRIFNDSSSEIRQQSGDTMKTLEEARERTEKRVKNHLDRYKRHYDINPYGQSQYDIVVDTMDQAPEEVADVILTAFTRWIDT
jgi:cytidylate kinase